MSPAHSRRGNAPALGRLWDLIRGKRGVDRHAPDTREIPREDGGDIVKELERILENQRVTVSPQWLKACDTEDMTRETTADENEEENGTDVESSIVLTTSFNPDLYKGVKFF
ncbi:hypothetical protein E5D57_013150 [Metarhizium anisopliae]|nr:hypothetical protein E5D57_013150 [Metarhizium anisopliae]